MANTAVVVENSMDVAKVEAHLAATGEEISMVETMVETVAKDTRLDEVMVEAVELHSNLNTRPIQANPCAIDVVWAITGLRHVGLPNI